MSSPRRTSRQSLPDPTPATPTSDRAPWATASVMSWGPKAVMSRSPEASAVRPSAKRWNITVSIWMLYAAAYSGRSQSGERAGTLSMPSLAVTRADERPERRPGLDRVLSAGPRGRERRRERLDVVQEKALRPLADLLDLAAAAELLDRLEEVHDLLRERRLAHAPAPGAEHLDLAVERRGLVLVERADHVVRERLVRIRVELAAREADDVRRVQARVLGVDRHEELDDLPGVERVEEDGGHLDGDGFAPLAQRVEGEQAVLAVEHAEHAVLFGDLQQPEVVVPRDRGEGEALLGGDDDRAGDRGQRTGVLALLVVGDQLVDLAADDRPLVGGLALGDPLLEHVPVHPRPHARAVLLRRLVPRAARVAQHLELHEPIDVLRREARPVGIDPGLLYSARRDSNHRAATVLGRQTPVNRGIFGL